MALLPLPPTSAALAAPDANPYFLWWTNVTIQEFRSHLGDPDPERRAYWLGALLREANTRDVWLFTTPGAVRELWPLLVRHLGRSRAMWAYLLDLEDPQWPPRRGPQYVGTRGSKFRSSRGTGATGSAAESLSATRARATLPTGFVELDVVHDAVPDIEAPSDAVEGVVIESLSDLRANKLTCILSRSEQMLGPLTLEELRTFRDDLRERFKRLAIP